MNRGPTVSREDTTNQPFHKLSVRLRKKIVADALDEDKIRLDISKTHELALEPGEWHDKIAMANPEEVCIVDCRNYYESEIGRFEFSKRMKVERFHESFDEIDEILNNEKPDKEIYLYCTGGIRCEKISAYVTQHKGFKRVNTLMGGINNYQKYIESTGKKSLFVGKNFQFDDRALTGYRDQTDKEVIATCDQCGSLSDVLRNCRNPVCNVLTNICDNCYNENHHTCSTECENILKLPLEEYEKHIRTKKKHKFRSTSFRRLVQYEQKREYTTDFLKRDEGYDQITPKDIRDYVEHYSSSINEETEQLFTKLKDFPSGGMSIGPFIGSFLSMMTKSVRANKVLEIGTFLGYSALCFAESLPKDGFVYTLESNPTHIQLARSHFDSHSQGHKVKLFEGKALDTLKDLKHEEFDVIFVDADKSNYTNYFNYIIDHKILSPTGVMFFDNVLFRGEVAKNATPGPTAQALSDFNKSIAQDSRVSQLILPIRDGLTMVVWK